MTPWNDTEIHTFLRRVDRFAGLGMDDDRAERLADRLAARDQEQDDRRVCAECRNLQFYGGCTAARQGRMPATVSPRLEPVKDMLQRCECFDLAELEGERQ